MPIIDAVKFCSYPPILKICNKVKFLVDPMQGFSLNRTSINEVASASRFVSEHVQHWAFKANSPTD